MIGQQIAAGAGTYEPLSFNFNTPAAVSPSPQFTEIAGLADQWLTEPSAANPLAASPSFFARMWEPVGNVGASFWSAGERVIEATSEKLPELLWGAAAQRLGLIPRTVQENAGTSTTYLQPPYSGGMPAGPTYTIPQQGGGVIPIPVPGGQAGGQGISGTTLAVIGIGLVVVFLFARGK